MHRFTHGREQFAVKESPYLNNGRLADVLSAIQFLACCKDYDLTTEELRKAIAREPISEDSWVKVLSEHPEFFRRSEYEDDFSLVLRRTKLKGDSNRRPPLESAELSMLMETATFLQRNAQEEKTLRRGWLQLGVSIFVAIVAAGAAISAALIENSTGAC